MTDSVASPFAPVLGGGRSELPAVLSEQYLLAADAAHRLDFTGTMFRIWHTPRWLWPVLRMLACCDVLFPEQGSDVPAAMTIEGTVDRRGFPAQSWRRTFAFTTPRRFDATVAFDHDLGRVVERVGPMGMLEIVWAVCFEPPCTMHIRTDGLRLALGRARLAVPAWAVVEVEAWETAQPPGDAAIEIRLVARHRLLGDIFGYDGRFDVSRVRRGGGAS